VCPPDNYDNPYGFENPIGDYTNIDDYRIISRDYQGSKQYSFTQADFSGFLAVLGDTVEYTPYDLVDDDIYGNFVGIADMLVFFEWFAVAPINDFQPELLEIGLNSQHGGLDFWSSGVGLFYHQEIDSLTVSGQSVELPNFGPGITHAFMARTPGDEEELYECWNSCTITFMGAGKYEMVK
jgi:hypothetical protein